MNLSVVQGRTFNPRVSHYRPNGGGRDTYIHANCGGFKPVNGAINSLNRKPRPDDYHMMPTRNWPTHKYRSDGTGRDFYVTVDSGGSQAAYVPGMATQTFQNLLRSSSAAPPPTQQHFRRKSPAERVAMRQTFNDQSFLTARLSSPKSPSPTRLEKSGNLSPHKLPAPATKRHPFPIRRNQRTLSMDANVKI